MMEDEIVNEVRAAREAFAAKYGYDIRAMVAALQAMDAAGDHPVVRLAPRRPTTGGRSAIDSHPEPTGSIAPTCSQPPVTEVDR